MYGNTLYESEEDDPTPKFVGEAINLYVIKKNHHILHD